MGSGFSRRSRERTIIVAPTNTSPNFSDQINYITLCVILKGPCQRSMRRILASFVQETDFKNVLKSNESYLSKHIHKNDLKIIFPNDNANVEYSKLDFTNMYAIMRNCKVFKQGIENASKSHFNLYWGKEPDKRDMTLLAAIERIRFSRNFDAHLPNAEVSDKVFKDTWATIETSLKNIENHLGCRDREFSKEMQTIKEKFSSELNVQQKATELQAEREGLKKKEKEIQKIWDSISGADEKYIEEYCETEKFIVTKAFEDVKRILQNEKYVLITGKFKSGKSMLAHNLMKWVLYEANTECSLLCKVFRTTESFKECIGENTVVLAEDIFHDIFEENRGRSASLWLNNLTYLQSLIKPSDKKGRYLIFSTNEKHFKEACRTHYSSGLLNERYVVNLSSKKYALSLEEKESMLKEFTRHSFHLSVQDKEILKNCDPPLGFPVTAKAYATDKTYRKQGIAFFENSVEFLSMEVEEMFNHDPNKFALFLFIYLQEDEPTVLDKSYKRFFDRKSLKNYEPYDVKSLKRAAGEISEVYIDEFKEMHFQFSHYAIRDALEHYILKNKFDIAMEVMNTSSLVSKLSIASTFRDSNIMSDEIKLNLLAKRFVEELQKSKLSIVIECEIWRNSENEKFLCMFKNNLSLELFCLKEDHWGLMYWIGFKQCHRLMKECINYLQAECTSDSSGNELLKTCLSEGICGLCHHADEETITCIKENTLGQTIINYKNSHTLECALGIAATNFHEEVVLLLLKQKATIDVPNWFPSILWTILHKAAFRGDRELCSSAFIRAIMAEEEISTQGNVRNVSRHVNEHEVIILSHLSGLNTWEDIFLALARHLKRPLHILESFKSCAPNFNVNCTKSDGKNAVHLIMLSFAETVKLYAIENDHPELIATRQNVCETIGILTNMSCNLAARDNEGVTAIEIHIQRGPDREILSKFVESGFDVQHNFRQTNLLGELLKTEFSDERLLPSVEYMLKEKVAIVTNRFIHSPLHYAILRERCKILDYLLNCCKSKFTEDICLKCHRYLMRDPDIDDETKTRLFEVLQRYQEIDFIDGKSIVSYIVKESSTSPCKLLKCAIQIHEVSSPDQDEPNDFPLHHWAKLSQDAEVMIDLLQLLTEYTSMDVVNAHGETPFMTYLRLSSNLNYEVIDAIMEKKPNISLDDFSGKTLLMHILSNKFVKFDIAKKFLEYDEMKIAQRDKKGKSHIHYILESSLSDDDAYILCKHVLSKELFSDLVHDQLSILQIDKRKEKTMAYLLEKIFEVPPCTLFELLHYLLEIGLLKTNIIENIKMKHPPGLTFKKNIFHTILKEEYQEPKDSLFLFQIFLDMGFDINQKDDQCFTPLLKACSKQTSFSLIKHLIKRGANTRNTVDSRNIVHFCLESPRIDEEVVEVLKVICDYDDSDRHKSFILDEKDSEMRSPIMIAFQCKEARTNTIRWLLGKAIDLFEQDASGNTIFHYCVASNVFDEDVVEILSCLMNSRRFHYGDLHCTDSSGQTPLHYCSKHTTRSRILSMIWLIERGADIRSIDNHGNTPLTNVLINSTNEYDIFAQTEKACRITILLLSYEKLASNLPDSIGEYTEKLHIALKDLFDSYPKCNYCKCLTRYIEKMNEMWDPENIDLGNWIPSIFQNRISEWMLIQDIICFISKIEFQISGDEIDSNDYTCASDYIPT